MQKITIIGFRPNSDSKIPLFAMSVSAGVPVPVNDDIEQMIDLNEYLVDHPRATYFAKVSGDNMKMAGISDGDILIVDTAIEPNDGKIVLTMLNDEVTIKYYRFIDGQEYLESHDSKFTSLSIGDEIKYKIIGTVTKIIHSL